MRVLGKVGANRRHSRGEYFLYVPVPEPVAGSGSLWICEHPIKTPPRLRLEKPDRSLLEGLGRSKIIGGFKKMFLPIFC